MLPHLLHYYKTSINFLFVLFYDYITNREEANRQMTTKINRGAESIGQVIHKEKNQKKYNKTTGQIDNLKGYGNPDTKSSGKLTTDKLIKREANYLKNIAIDKAFNDLLRMNMITDIKYQGWYCKCLHTLGVAFVMAQAHLAAKNAKNPDNPAPLFHFLINKEMNKAIDPYMPKFGS